MLYCHEDEATFKLPILADLISWSHFVMCLAATKTNIGSVMVVVPYFYFKAFTLNVIVVPVHFFLTFAN